MHKRFGQSAVGVRFQLMIRLFEALCNKLVYMRQNCCRDGYICPPGSQHGLMNGKKIGMLDNKGETLA